MLDCANCRIDQEFNVVLNVSDSIAKTGFTTAREGVFHETLGEVLNQVRFHGGLDRGLIALADQNSEHLTIEVMQDRGQDRSLPPVTYEAGQGIIGQVFESSEPAIVPRLDCDSRFMDKLEVYEPSQPFLAVPIIAGARPIGVLAAQPAEIDCDCLDSQSRFLSVVANLVGQIVRVSRAMEEQLETVSGERDRLLEKIWEQYGIENIVGQSPAMQRVFEQIAAVSKWTTTVLIRGESGTGKELVAHALHYNSPRADKPFIKLNAAALSDQLLESELFGHEKGSFTGATDHRLGRFERADGGTFFLDEIGEISASFQSKLLRILQEGEFERVGGSTTRSVDVRIVAATNRDLEADVAAGKFRQDLYYRLNVMPIHMPPLRSRLEDVPYIARHLLGRIGDRHGISLSITDSAVALLMRYEWPGNVRELENLLERAAILAGNGRIDREAVARTGIEDRIVESGGTLVAAPSNFNDPGLDERDRIVAALEHCGWVQAKAARLLGMTARQIAYRIQTLDIKLRKI